MINRLIDCFALITDSLIIKTKDQLFMIMFSANMVKVSIQNGPYLPWKPLIEVKD